jgi:hypothetical protein
MFKSAEQQQTNSLRDSPPSTNFHYYMIEARNLNSDRHQQRPILPLASA